MGFKIEPLTQDHLDTSGDFVGGPHPVEEDPLYKRACTNRDEGNEMVKSGEYEGAVAKYSEMIMQIRALVDEEDVQWTNPDGSDGHDLVHQLRATAYLNLSLCFLKLQQWTHASNTATRALQGDKDPPDPKHDVLAPERKAKALFRRAQAQSEGFGNYEKAISDLKAAQHLSPEDKAVKQELQRIEQVLSKSVKEAEKKMAGFLSSNKKAQSGEGIFDEKLRPKPDANPKPKNITEPKKLKEGLWVVPEKEKEKDKEKEEGDEDCPDAGPERVDYEELTREINEMREDNPEAYAKLREQVKEHIEKAAAEGEKVEDPVTVIEQAAAA